MTDTCLLESDQWRLWLTPAAGVQWLAAEVLHHDQWVAVVPDCRPASGDAEPPAEQPHSARGAGNDTARAGQDEHTPLAAANFHMLPYSNRVRNGQFDFAGQRYTLDNAERHAMHGALRKLPWRILSQSTTELICAYDSDVDGALNWPWPLQAELRHTVAGCELRSEMTLTNSGSTPMPAGMGWHPYFVRNIGGAGPRLRLPVSGLYPDAAGDCLPDGAAEPLPAALDFRELRNLEPDQRIDACLNGLSGACDIQWPGAGLALTVAASENCGHLVFFNPDMPHFAVEPVANANDGFNLQAQGIEAGVVTLAPGQSLSAWMTVVVRSLT